MILYITYYKKNRARYGGKDIKTSEPFLMQVPMKRLLAHVSTKDELTQYLASKTLEKGRQNGLHVVVAWSSKCRATHKDMAYLDSDQEEADTKILLHAVGATASGAKSIKIFLPDTNMFVWPLDDTRSFVRTVHSSPEEDSATEISRFFQLSAL